MITLIFALIGLIFFSLAYLSYRIDKQAVEIFCLDLKVNELKRKLNEEDYE